MCHRQVMTAASQCPLFETPPAAVQHRRGHPACSTQLYTLALHTTAKSRLSTSPVRLHAQGLHKVTAEVESEMHIDSSERTRAQQPLGLLQQRTQQRVAGSAILRLQPQNRWSTLARCNCAYHGPAAQLTSARTHLGGAVMCSLSCRCCPNCRPWLRSYLAVGPRGAAQRLQAWQESTSCCTCTADTSAGSDAASAAASALRARSVASAARAVASAARPGASSCSCACSLCRHQSHP